LNLLEFPEATNLVFPSPIQLLNSPLLDAKKIKLYVKREDLIHPIIGGNKWRKLKYNIIELQRSKAKTILSFGGAYSNHIYALAGVGQLFGLNTIGIIRGESCEPLNPTLAYAKKVGMQLHYVSRKDYRLKETSKFIESLKSQFGEFTLIPEGGSNELALPGCAEIIEELDAQLSGQYDTVCLPCGTAGTLAGLISSGTKKNLLGIAVLKGAKFLHENINHLLSESEFVDKNKSWKINLNYHFDGYAKKTPELMRFISNFNQEFNINIERIYSGKMFYGLFDLIKNDFFEQGTTIVALHTGGMQNEDI